MGRRLDSLAWRHIPRPLPIRNIHPQHASCIAGRQAIIHELRPMPTTTTEDRPLEYPGLGHRLLYPTGCSRAPPAHKASRSTIIFAARTEPSVIVPPFAKLRNQEALACVVVSRFRWTRAPMLDRPFSMLDDISLPCGAFSPLLRGILGRPSTASRGILAKQIEFSLRSPDCPLAPLDCLSRIFRPHRTPLVPCPRSLSAASSLR